MRLDEEDDEAMDPRRASPDIGPPGHVNLGSLELDRTHFVSLDFDGFATYRFLTSETCVPPDFQFATPARRKAGTANGDSTSENLGTQQCPSEQLQKGKILNVSHSRLRIV